MKKRIRTHMVEMKKEKSEEYYGDRFTLGANWV